MSLNIIEASVVSICRVFESREHRSGSGLIADTGDADFLYVLTARHCLGEDEKSVRIYTYDNRDLSAAECVVSSPETDLAVIKIKRIPGEYVNIFTEARIRKEATVAGFPDALSGEQQSLRCLIKSCTNLKEFETEFYIERTDTKTERDLSDGFSGGPVFFEAAGKPCLLGLVKEVKDEEMAYKAVKCIGLDEINTLLAKGFNAELHILPEYIADRAGWHYTTLYEWQNKYKSPWIENNYSRELSDKIIEALLGKGSASTNVFYLGGHSGSGKTRTVLNSCAEKSMDGLMYFSDYLDFCSDEAFIKELLDNEYKLTVVADECTLSHMRRLNRDYYNNENIIILTVGMPSREDNTLPGYIAAEPNPSDVGKIIRANAAGISDAECAEIIRLSNNDLNFVVFLCELYENKVLFDYCFYQNLSSGNAFISGGDIFERVLRLHSSDLDGIDKEVFTDCWALLSLVADIGAKGADGAELRYFAEFFGTDLSLLVKTTQISVRCNLGRNKSDFFEAMPKALAIMMFVERGWGRIEHRLTDFINGMPSEIQKKRFMDFCTECVHRAGREFGETVNTALIRWFCDEFPAKDILLLDFESKVEIFSVYVEYHPEYGLKWLYNAVKATSDDMLAEWGSVGDLRDGRRHTVWLCEQLAGYEDHFFKCEFILFRLAENETEQIISNNATNVWSALYSPFLSQTETSFSEKLKILRRRLNKATEKNIDLVLKGVKSSFVLSGVCSVRRNALYNTVNKENIPLYEIKNIFRQSFEVLAEYVNDSEASEENKARVIEFIINEMGLLLKAFISKEVVGLFTGRRLTREHKLKLVIKLNELLSMGWVKSTEAEYLKSLLSTLDPTDTEERILLFLSNNPSRYRSDANEIRREAAAVAKEMISRNIGLDLIDAESQEKYDTYALECLARELAGADNGQYRQFFMDLLRNDRCFSLLRGYMEGLVVYKDIADFDEFSMLMDSLCRKYPSTVLNISVGLDIRKKGLQRIKDILSIESFSDIHLLSNLKYKEWYKIMEYSDILELFTALNRHGNLGTGTAIMLDLFLAWGRLDNGFITEELIAIIFSSAEECIAKGIYIEIYLLVPFFNSLPSAYFCRIIETLCGIMLSDASSPHGRDSSEDALCSYAQGNTLCILDTVRKILMSQKMAYVFRIIPRRKLFGSLNAEEAVSWVKAHEDFLRHIVLHLPSPFINADSGLEIPRLTDLLMSEYEYDDDIVSLFIDSRRCFECIDLEKEVEGHKETTAKLKVFTLGEKRWVCKWAEAEIKKADYAMYEYTHQQAEDERLTTDFLHN